MVGIVGLWTPASGGSVIEESTFALRGTGSEAGEGRWITDVGPVPFLIRWNGSAWKLTGPVVLYHSVADVVLSSDTNENQSHVTQTLPAGLLSLGQLLSVYSSASKATTSNSVTMRYRFGPAGDNTDVGLYAYTAAISGANPRGGWHNGIRIISTTSMQQVGRREFSYLGTSGTSASSAATVADISTDNLKFSMTWQCDVAQVVTVSSMRLELWP